MNKLAGLLLVAIATAFSAADILTIFGHKWTVPIGADWQITSDNGTPVLHMTQGREPLPGPRRPFQFAMAETAEFSSARVELDAKPLKRSLIVVYAYRDPSHFDYVHFSTDTATKQPVHNGVFHVFGGERVRISSTAGPAAFEMKDRWYHLQVKWDGATGEVEAVVDGKPVPSLKAVDLSLNSGKIGIGSFDETADFKNVKIEGTPAQQQKLDAAGNYASNSRSKARRRSRLLSSLVGRK